MTSLFTIDGIKELLEIIKQYIVYVYPGFITVVFYRFAMSKSVEENKNTFIKSIIISYLYTIPISHFSGITPSEFTMCQHVLLLGVSVLIPLAWNRIIRWEGFRKIIRGIGIKTEIYDNLMDIMFYKENGKVWVRAYLDEQKVMYEGSLRHYESDIKREQQIFLSGYREIHYNETTCKYDKKIYDYASDESKWVRIFEKNITRMEFEYLSPH